MEDRLALLRRPFLERAHVSRVWGGLAYAWPRNRLMVALAAGPALLILLLALASPHVAGQGVADAENVDATFARFISAVATAATVAVSVAALVLGRELKGISGQDERHASNLAFRDDVRRASGLASVPMALGTFLSVALDVVGRRAREARETATAQELAHEAEGVPLGRFLEHLEEESALVARKVQAERRHPHRLLTSALRFEQEVSHHLARRFAREEALPQALRDRVDAITHAIKDIVLATRYVKTLDTQWGLSRMSSAVLLTTLPAILAAVLMVLLYDRRLVEAWGVLPSAALVCAALAVTLLPIAAIVSYLLRFVFINQHTLPAEDFVLGPELPDVVEDAVPSGVEPARQRRARAS